jgi:hypothetical protein
MVSLSCIFYGETIVYPKKVQTLATLQGLQVLFGFYIFYVDPTGRYKSIEKFSKKFGGIIHLLMLIYNFFVVPITTYVFFLKSDKSAIYESSMLNFSLLVSFFSLIVFFRTVFPLISKVNKKIDDKIAREHENENLKECSIH